MNILQYEPKIWATADILRGCAIKESEWPALMMPFFALAMIESRLIRRMDELREEIGEENFAAIDKDDLYAMLQDEKQGYNFYILEKKQSFVDLCKNDKTFEIDFEIYLRAFDGETKDLLGVDAVEGEEFLNIKGVIAKLKAKKVLFSYAKLWSEVDLRPFNNSEITTLEEHIKRKWADISAETAGEQYTPDDVIALIAEIIASKIVESDKLLKIYDCTCGGGNLLFGVEDRINAKSNRLTQTFGQDLNNALYALARIEGRFRPDAKIEHGNTLIEDRFYNEEFDIIIANPPYGVSWKGFEPDIKNDKTQRFKYLPSISDGQLLFMQHLISKMALQGMGVVVHNGSTLFSGDAGSAESNIRKWMLDTDIVEAIVQLPTDEFFNTGIYTYLWVLNKNKKSHCKDKVMLINASEKFRPLKKSKGSKRKEVDEASRLDIVATLGAFEDNEYARVFDKEFFYFNKQAIMLTNVDENGKSLAAHLPEGKTSLKLSPASLTNGAYTIDAFKITENDMFATIVDGSLFERYEAEIKPSVDNLDYKEQPIVVTDEKGVKYWFDAEKETLARETKGVKEELGCGKIVVKAAYKPKTNKDEARVLITVELVPDYQKDYEIIAFHKDVAENKKGVEAFMKKYVSKPFAYLENVVGVEINFNKVFYKPEPLRSVGDILGEIATIDVQVKALEAELAL
jgi:type I restriction enzyme M protein